MSWKLVQQKKDGVVLDLTSDVVTFGRQQSCTFPFKSSYLSRKHAKMQFDGTQWTIMDENSMNGVFVKAHQIPSNVFVALSEGDIIGFGMPICTAAKMREDFYGVYKLQRVTEEPAERLLTGKEDQINNSDQVVPGENNVGGVLPKRKTKHSDLIIIVSSDEEDEVEKKHPIEPGITSTSNNTTAIANATANETEFDECQYSQADEIIEISDDEGEDFPIKSEGEVKTEDDEEGEEEGYRFKLRMQEQLDWNDEGNANNNFSTTSADALKSEFWCPPSPELEIIENEDEKVDDNVSKSSIKEVNDTDKFGNEEVRVPTTITENVTPGNVIADKVVLENVIAKKVVPENIVAKKVVPENIIAKKALPENVIAKKVVLQNVIAKKIVIETVPPEITEISNSLINSPIVSQALVPVDPILSETISVVECEPKQIDYEKASEGRIANALLNDNGEQFFPILSQGFEESNEYAENENCVLENDNDDFRLQQVKARIAHKPVVDRLKQSSRGQHSPFPNVAAVVRKQKAVVARTIQISALNLSSRNKTKNSSIHEKIQKQFGNRVRVPGGGSAIRCQSGAPSTSGGSSEVKNTDNKASDKSELFIRPETKSCRPKVYQKPGASRGEKLLESMGSNTTPKPPLKRPASTTTLKSQPVVKKPHLTLPGVSNSEISGPLVKKARLSNTETSPVQLNDEMSPPLVRKTHLAVSKTSPEITSDGSTKANSTAFNAKPCFPKERAIRIINSSVNEASAIVPKINGDNFRRPLKCAESILRNHSSNTSSNTTNRDPRQVCFNETTEIRMVDKYIKETRGSTGTGPANNYKRSASVKRIRQISPYILTVLGWNISWMQEQKQFANVPPLVPKGCMQTVKDIYTSPEEYKETYGSLIAYESWTEISEQNDVNKNPLNLQFCLKEYKYNNSGTIQSMELCGYGVTERIDARDLRTGWLGTLCVYVDDNSSVEKQKNTFSDELNNENDSTFNQHSKSRKVIFAYAEDVILCARSTLPEDIPISLQNLLKNPNNLVFRLAIRTKVIDLSSQCKEKPMKFTMISYLLNYVRIYDAVHSLDIQILGDLILNSGTLNPLSEECLIKPSIHTDELNNSQKEAVLRVTDMCYHKIDVPNICLIHGPPGTGKTKVIIAIIRELLIQKDCKYTFLVCAPSNSAVDELTRRLIGLKKEVKEKKIAHIHLVRVNQHPNLEEDIREYTVDKYLERKKKAKQQTDNVGPQSSSIDSRREVINRANVITTTLGSCSRSEMEILHSKQIICIIDEATQCVEPEAILPLSYPVKKLILVGDHKQLPATVRSMHASGNFYNKSLFERLFCNYSKEQSKAICSLNVQYRMHKEICTYPSKTFYDGKLFTAENLNLRNNFPFHNYHVFNVYDGQEIKLGKDIINQKESDFVYKLCEVLLKESVKSIGIITFYSAQKSFMDKRKFPLLKEKAKYVEVNTVDAFQGREKDVIILSAVRANGNQNIGFTGSCNRINVALTRARYALYVIGHLKTLQSNEDWNCIFEDAKRRNKLTVVTSRFDNGMIEALLKQTEKHTS